MISDIMRRDRILYGPISGYINTTTKPTATTGMNGRNVARCKDGTLWVCYNEVWSSQSIMHFSYSKDNGATWTVGSTPNIVFNSSYTYSTSLFIDEDDYAHIVYKENGGTGYTKYMRGTPNASRTSWTWSAELFINSASLANYPDIIAHRNPPSVGGWTVHMVMSYLNGSTFQAMHVIVNVSSAGVPAIGPNVILEAATASAHGWMSIDFHHTGNSKTVKDDQPNIYITWAHQTSTYAGSTKFKKGTYNPVGHTWVWDPVVTLDATRWWNSNSGQIMFDGTRVVVAVPQSFDGYNFDNVLYERDEANTTTIVRVITDNPATDNRLTSGAATYDSFGNVYFFGQRPVAGVTQIVRRKWNRATLTVDADHVIEQPTNYLPYFTVKRGTENGRVEYAYVSRPSSTYLVMFGGFDI